MDVSQNIWKIYLFRFLTGMHFIGAVLVPFFIDWGHLDMTQILILQSVFLGTMFLMEVPTGVIADRFSRKASLILGACFVIMGVLVYVSLPIFWVFVFAEVLWATGAALFSGADEALLYDTLKATRQTKKSKQILARAANFFLAGLMVAAPLGSLIYMAFKDVRAPVLFMIIPYVLAIVVGILIKEPKKTENESESRRYFDLLKSGLKFLSGHKIIKILALDMIVIWSLAFFIIWLWQPLLMSYGIKIEYFGFIQIFLLGGEIIVISQYKRFDKLFRRKRGLIILSSLILGFCFIGLSFISSIYIVIPLIILAASFGLSREPLFSSYMNKYISSKERATVLSSVNMLRSFFQAVLNPFIGFFADNSIKITFLLLGISVLIFTTISGRRIKEKMLID